MITWLSLQCSVGGLSYIGVLSQFGPLDEHTTFLEDGYVSGGTAIMVVRRNSPSSSCTTAELAVVQSPALQTQRGYAAFVHSKLSTNSHHIWWHECIVTSCFR